MPQRAISKGEVNGNVAWKPIDLDDFSREILEDELESVGIRLNSRKPDIYFKVELIDSSNVREKNSPF